MKLEIGLIHTELKEAPTDALNFSFWVASSEVAALDMIFVVWRRPPRTTTWEKKSPVQELIIK